MNFLLRHLERRSLEYSGGSNEGFDAELKPIPCESFEELIDTIKKVHPLTQPQIDAVAATLAIAVSLRIPGPMLWSHLVGASSSGKTQIASIVGAAHDRCFTVSELTSLYSGSTVGGKDNSIVPRIQGRMLIVKDLTPLLQSRPEVQNAVFGQLRDIYDGKGEKFFNNGEFRQYGGVRFSCLTCTTSAVRAFSRSDMGERFLAFQLDSYWNDEGRLIKLAIDTDSEGNAYDSLFDTISGGLADATPRLDNLAEARAKCWGFINHLHAVMDDESEGLQAVSAAFRADRSFKAVVDCLTIWLEHARCPKPKNPDEATVRPEQAQPHRGIKQLAKAAMCLSIIYGHKGPSDEIRRVIKKWGFDTCISFALEIMNYVATHPRASKDAIAARLQISNTYCNSWCAHLITIGVLNQVLQPNGSGNRGRHSLCYELTPNFRMVADTLGLVPNHKNAVEAALARSSLFGMPPS